MLSFTKKKEDDPLLEYLLRFRQRIGQARQRLTDAEKTAFFFVTLPEALPIAGIARFIGWFHDFGIPVGGVVVNMVLDRQCGRRRRSRVRPEPGGHAGRAHADHLGEV
jgi:arsenite-transporting ATPase